MAAYERQARAAARQAEIEHWAEADVGLAALAQAHTEYFPVSRKPVAPEPEPVDVAALRRRRERELVSGISVFKRRDRKAAKARAGELAAADAGAERAQRAEERDRLQAQLDATWDALLANRPETVFEAIEAAFEDNEMPAACIDVQRDSATLLMRIAPPDELVPERTVAFTPTGRASHRKRNKTEVNQLYALVLASHVLAVVNEALAVAPGLREVQAVVVRGDRVGGSTVLGCLYAGRFLRAEVARLDFDDDDLNPLTVIEDADGLIHYKGRTQELAPLALRDEPDLRAVLDDIADQLGWRRSAPAGTRS